MLCLFNCYIRNVLFQNHGKIFRYQFYEYLETFEEVCAQVALFIVNPAFLESDMQAEIGLLSRSCQNPTLDTTMR